MSQQSTAFPTLFSPIQLGGVVIKNRIVSTGHDTTIPTDGTVNDALIAYHEARAAGGAGLIISQVVGVHESARYTSHVLMGTDDSCIDGFRQLAQCIKPYGTRFFVQLFHPGREIMESQDGSAPVAFCPSLAPTERSKVIPRTMPLALIKELIDGYIAAASRMQQAGADGIEIVASHGYLPSQFLNPNVNQRTDQYGGSFENRQRFVREIIAGIRSVTEDTFVVGLRISQDERDPQGLSQEDATASIADLAPFVDYIGITAGTSKSLGGAIHIVPPMVYDNGYLATTTAPIQQTTQTPIILSGRINQPQEAEQILREGQADMCGMTRAMICDPCMPNKAQAGKIDSIRACIGCNQACIGHFHKGYPISCIQHPETGRERQYGNLPTTDHAKQILVIGGGPAGMKAATVAATRGHKVTLLEQASQLGGQVKLAQQLPKREEFGGLITNLSYELAQSGCEIKCNTPVDSAVIKAYAPDTVILATGAKPLHRDHLMLGDDAHVVDAWQVIDGSETTGTSVVIADWRGDWIGLGVAEKLAEAGCHVRLAVNGLFAGELLQSYVRDSTMARLHRLGIEVIPYARLFGFDEGTVYLQHTASEEAMMIDHVDSLVLALGHAPNNPLEPFLIESGINYHAIGDCLMARTAEEAVLEGLKIGAIV